MYAAIDKAVSKKKSSEVKKLEKIKSGKMLINSDYLYFLIIPWHCIISQVEQELFESELFKVLAFQILKSQWLCLIKLKPTKPYCVILARKPVKSEMSKIKQTSFWASKGERCHNL